VFSHAYSLILWSLSCSRNHLNPQVCHDWVPTLRDWVRKKGRIEISFLKKMVNSDCVENLSLTSRTCLLKIEIF